MADHFGRTFTRADQTPQPHNHPSDPTLDELIAEWVERSRSCVPASEYHQKVVATAAALRELRELSGDVAFWQQKYAQLSARYGYMREAVARVRELHVVYLHDNGWGDGAEAYCKVCGLLDDSDDSLDPDNLMCPTLRALTPEGTT